MATIIKARPASIRWMVRGLSIMACIALWQVASTTHLNLGIVTFRNVPPPVEVVQSALAPVSFAEIDGTYHQ
ncbi:ABC-type nitrate/sulfonate/bicarbonate transport system permease component [Bradyrhizobium japonicum]